MSSEQDYQDLFGPQAKKAKRGREQLQTDKSANAIRIRDNQRRSRARHKEFVDELQRKVQEYEKRGIEASVQMQKAARDVSIENARLKALLASRGVSGEQVEAYLRSFEDDSKGSPVAPLPATLPPILNTPVVLEPSPTQLPPLQEHFSNTRFSSEPEGDSNNAKRKFGDTLPPVLTLTPTPDVQQNSPLDKLTMLANASLNRSSQPPPPTQTIPEPGRNPHFYERRSQTPPRRTESHRPPAASPHEMSCNAAARIIADMQGYGDERTARISLGCRTQDDECFVKNTTVFRALDHR
ncbi:uncharacterized protein CTRU02_201428 [Colletotrichum truncatum]|uniref:Uncharacterized protein n=1 Tax=Colletotrichum truncatum TaxID=5467 RepID=A0ACC3ZHD4_COLTU|nr:uncharacterized protein CTRU02_15486 [Colletotrichum truncatum]KAF6781018.1 hypothetical protein CTRU02_15486 [Colletotrichum truncatum]